MKNRETERESRDEKGKENTIKNVTAAEAIGKYI